MENISDILLWSFIIGFGVMFVWLVMLLSASNFMYKLHTRIFGLELSKGTYMLLHLCGIGIWKMVVMLFFFIPWLAIQIVGK